MKKTEYELQLPVLIGDIYRLWREQIDAIAKKYSLTRTEWHIIGKLECRGPKMPQKQLSALTGLSNAQLTKALNKLEDGGYIIRSSDNNRRENQVALKNIKAKYIEEIRRINNDINNSITNNLTTDQNQQLIKLLQITRTSLQDLKKDQSQ